MIPFRKSAGALLASAAMFLAVPDACQAQNPSWLRFTTVVVKPESVPEYEGYVKQMAQASVKGGLPFYVVYVNFAGNMMEYTTVTPVMKFGDLQGPGPAQKVLGEEAYRNLVRGLQRCATSSRRYFSLPWDDAGFNKGGTSEYWMRTTIPVQPDKMDAYRAYLKDEVKPAYEKAGVAGFLVSRPVFGGPAATIETVRMMKNLAEIDDGPFNRKAFGANMAAMNAKAAGMTRGASQSTIIRVRTDLSVMPPMGATR